MNTKLLLEYADFSVIVVCLFALCAIWRTRQPVKFRSLSFYVGSLAILMGVQTSILFFRSTLGLDKVLAYQILFWSTQTFSCLQTILTLAIIFNAYNEAMRPLKGLQRIGGVVFRWVLAVSVVLGLIFAIGPHMLSTGNTSDMAFTSLIERAQEGINVLMLCLLLFVCIAIRPLGLTFRSHVFGVTLSLGMISVTELVQAAWFYTTGARSVYSPIYLFGTIGYLVALATVGVFILVPEPERKMVLLPTTSPFFFWNRIAEELGDPPGHVAIRIKPTMFAPIELTAFARMGKYNRERKEAAEAAAAAAAEANSNEKLGPVAVS